LSYREPGRYHASGSLVSTENGVGYVKRNAIAGRSFPSWEAFEAHLEAWTRDVARYARAWHDRRGADRAVPARRGKNSHAIAGIPPFQAARELFRRVQSDCAVEIDGNAYSVPWRLIGEMVRVTKGAGSKHVKSTFASISRHWAKVEERSGLVLGNTITNGYENHITLIALDGLKILDE
jgi:Mu transposase, C-terminal domain